MFTIPPNTPVGGFLEGLANKDLGSRLRATWLNYVANQLPNALDAIGGGYYQFAGDIRLSSDTHQVKINAPTVADPIELRGFVTIGLSDDANYVTGTGTLTVSIPASFFVGVTCNNTLTMNGAVTLNGAMTCTSNGDITLQSGCTVTGQSGSSITMASGASVVIQGGATLNCQASSTTTLAGTNTLSGTTTIGGAVSITGRRQLHRARVTLSDANQSVNVGQGDRFLLPANNAAPRNIELTSTGTVPNEGETLEFYWHPAGAGGAGTQYSFKREDATVVATLVGSSIADTGTVFVEFEFVGGVWRLGRSSGTPCAYIPPVPGPEAWESYGVVPGAGA